jgi:GDP-4-dehydro-6-deoxy-D-mannose reductase
MRVLVTGAAGFVGRRLVARLAQEGADVTGVDREVDVADAEAVRRAVAEVRPDAVVHLAALTFVPDSFARPRDVFRVNFLGSRCVLEAVRGERPGARVLLVSTAHVYGSARPEDPPFDEGSPLRPGSPYAAAKAAADLLGAAYARRGVDVVRVRPFNHTGPGRPDSFAESSFARQIAEIEAGLREPVLAVGNLDAVRDFLDVDDVIDAYVRLLDRAVPAGVYNIASGRATSLRALLDALLARSPAAPEVRVDRALWRPADACVGRADRLAAACGWKPSRPLEATLGALLDHWRDAVRAPGTPAPGTLVR